MSALVDCFHLAGPNTLRFWMLLVMVVFLFLMGLVITRYEARQDEDDAWLDEFADEHLDEGNRTGPRALRGRLGGDAISVKERIVQPRDDRGAVRYADCALAAPRGLQLHFHITRPTLWTRLSGALGLGPSYGEDDPRRRFHIADSAQRDQLGDMLAEEGQLTGALDELFGLGYGDVYLREGRFEVSRRLRRGDLRPDRLRRVFAALAILAGACAGRQVSVKVKGRDTQAFGWTGQGQSVRCPYCKDDLRPEAPDLAACDRCQTLHHEGCLEEGGGCSIFGCQGGRPQRSGLRA
jgi:hypothetical protein